MCSFVVNLHSQKLLKLKIANAQPVINEWRKEKQGVVFIVLLKQLRGLSDIKEVEIAGQPSPTWSLLLLTENAFNSKVWPDRVNVNIRN